MLILHKFFSLGQISINTFSVSESVNFVRLFSIIEMQFSHLFNVRRFVECTAKSRLQLCKVWSFAAIAQTSSIFGPLLISITNNKLITNNLLKDKS